jgi:hypothetical protein
MKCEQPITVRAPFAESEPSVARAPIPRSSQFERERHPGRAQPFLRAAATAFILTLIFRRSASVQILPWGFGFCSPAAAKAKVTVESLETEEEQLRQRIAEIEQRKADLLKAKEFRLVPCYEGKGVLISKEGERMGVMLADVPDLIKRLKAHLEG